MMSESEYSCVLSTAERIRARQPVPESKEGLRLRVLEFRLKNYEATQMGKPRPNYPEALKLFVSVLASPRRLTSVPASSASGRR